MMFIQFFQKSAIDDKLIEACGDRSVVVVDGRSSWLNTQALAQDEGKKRGYLAYQVFRGESFTRCKPSTQVKRIYP